MLTLLVLRCAAKDLHAHRLKSIRIEIEEAIQRAKKISQFYHLAGMGGDTELGISLLMCCRELCTMQVELFAI